MDSKAAWWRAERSLRFQTSRYWSIWILFELYGAFRRTLGGSIAWLSCLKIYLRKWGSASMSDYLDKVDSRTQPKAVALQCMLQRNDTAFCLPYLIFSFRGTYHPTINVSREEPNGTNLYLKLKPRNKNG